jgi:predicted AlkP superfamily pyrophosphatase or phosphodiesterase
MSPRSFWLRLFALLTVAVLAVLSATVSQAQAVTKPRLVVVLVVDQLRADYLDKYEDLFLPPGRSGRDAGGFRFLRDRGARYTNAHYKHFPLFTGPGHAVVLTGGYPYKTGIVGNDWYSKANRATVYCVQDPRATVIGGGAASTAKPMSPANLRSTTVGDELKMATGGAAKVVTLSLKDRAAILLGGRLADASIWFDDSTGRWISSDFYCRNDQLPAWVQSVNERKMPASYLGQQWIFSLPESTKTRLWQPIGVPVREAPYQMGNFFPHPIGNMKAFTHTPWANAFVLETAKTAVTSNAMGADETPDVLAVNLATNDYTGHEFGGQSPELLDVTVQTDRQLSDFFRFLDRTVPGGLDAVTFALTADHGAANVPEELTAAGFRAGRILDTTIERAAETALDSRFGQRDWVMRYVEPSLYLNDAVITAAGIDYEAAQKIAARSIAGLNGIYNTYTRAQVQEGRVADNDLAARLAKGFYPKVSGDVFVVTEQGWFTESSPSRLATTHGSPYAYDTHVPLLLAGAGIRPGIYHENVCPADLAPSLSTLLGIALPSASDGNPLSSALR